MHDICLTTQVVALTANCVSLEDYAKALEKDKKAQKPRRKSHVPLPIDGSRQNSLTTSLSPDIGLIPTARTAPTAAYQPYLDGAHLNSRPGTPAEASPSFAQQSGLTLNFATYATVAGLAQHVDDMLFVLSDYFWRLCILLEASRVLSTL